MVCMVGMRYGMVMRRYADKKECRQIIIIDYAKGRRRLASWRSRAGRAIGS